MTVNFTKGKFNLREKLKELERPSVDKLVTRDGNDVYIDTITGNTKLENIDTVISDTAVDIFIYDTSKDSDGGAWRKRTTHTSWYNETLNTSVRGSRREFPAVAVIVLEGYTLTIYDGDDPDLPMWMVFNATTQSWNSVATWLSVAYQAASNPMTAVSALNSKLAVTGKEYGIVIIDFIDESHIQRGRVDLGSGIYALRHKTSGSIALRNDTSGQYVTTDTGLIVNRFVNDVAMTVLPNAPIDSVTGLPTPTIAVATDGGVSVIKDDGNVYDVVHTTTPYTNYVHFVRPELLSYSQDSGVKHKWTGFIPIPTSDKSNTYQYNNATYTWYANYWGTGNTNILVATPTVNPENLTYTAINPIGSDMISFGSSKGLGMGTLENSPPRMIAYVTTSYNTGYMVGDIKGAFLSDTDTTNLSGSELVSNGTFTTDLTDWSNDSEGNGTASVVSSALQLYTPTQSTEEGRVSQQITTLTSGKTYVLSATTDAAIILQIGVSAVGSSELVNQTITGPAGLIFTATSSSVYLSVRKFTPGTANVDNISLREAELDRSVNNNGLQVFGTITKSAVATGAELVAYSGWSNSNYLVQPYNSDLNFGTGDFSTSFWIYTTDANLTGFVFDRGGPVNNTDPRFAVYIESDAIILYTYASAASSTLSHSFDEYENQWTHVVMTRDSTGAMQIFINGTRVSSGSATARNVTSSTNPELTIGNRFSRDGTNPLDATISLLRISGSIPSAEQVKKMYEDEKVLFQENAACTLYGSSDAVTALAYDEVTDRLYAGTSSGRSDFQGLRRINNTTTAVTTAISAHDEFIVEQ